VLRDKHGESVNLSLEIPIFIANNRNGAKQILIDPTRLPNLLTLQKSDLVNLQRDGLIPPQAPVKIPRVRVDYPALAQEYGRQLSSGKYSTRAGLARTIGVTRAWVTKVMKKGSSKVTCGNLCGDAAET
jgi:hypothetical protein